MKVTLVSTLLNEAKGIDEFLASLQAQRRPPDEWVVVDGGSTDGTSGALEAFAVKALFPVRILCEAGCNIARGRNLAIRAAQYDIIAATDAGCRLDPGWLEALVEPFSQGAAAVAGWYEPDPRTPFERRISMATFQRLDQVDPATFLPSSRSIAFRRDVWQTIGGYPEGLRLTGEDTAFDLAVQRAGYSFVFTPQAVVRWRPRGTWRGFLRQQYLYGFGDGEAGQAGRMALRNTLKTALSASGLVVIPLWPRSGLCLAMVFVLILTARLRQFRWPWHDVVPGVAILPMMWTSQVLGYVVGLWCRWKSRIATSNIHL